MESFRKKVSHHGAQIIHDKDNVMIKINKGFRYQSEVQEILQRLRQHVHMRPIVEKIATFERKNNQHCKRIKNENPSKLDLFERYLSQKIGKILKLFKRIIKRRA